MDILACVASQALNPVQDHGIARLALCVWPPGGARLALTYSALHMQVQTAKAILTTPELRKKYEAGGMDALDEASLTEHGIQACNIALS